ncbi:MAG: Na+/H+ antiporter subunit E [Campylobacteraceae bacterium]|jgi:multicomponent K+:H+ antiporter subunit E|nr:Na+/H+ antiporter subunit E [Campylobacteraceae bacterium]
MENKRSRSWFSRPVLSLILWVSWLLLNNTTDPGHIVLGAILAILIPWFTSDFWPGEVRVKNFKVLLKYSFIVLYDIVVANIVVAKQVLGPNSALKPDFFEVPLDITNPMGISILASTITLTPGTVSADLSPDKKTLKVHALHLEDVQAEIKSIKDRYEAPLMEVFE